MHSPPDQHDPVAPQTVAELERQLSQPTDQVVELFGRMPGDLIFLGVGGKMGPTMARMARIATDRAGVERRIIGVSRFSDPSVRRRLESWNVETIACDLLDPNALARLPDAAHVIAMTGFKFGAGSDPSRAWAMNVHLPALLAQRFASSRIVALSTGNVYGMVPVDSGGSRCSDLPQPVGEYAMTSLGRERMYQYFSNKLSIPTVLLRLNYATELRYGVLVDLAEGVREGRAVDLCMGYVNVIWLGDANAMTLRALEHCQNPARILNMAGPEILSIREVCQEIAERMGRKARFRGSEGQDAFLNNAQSEFELLGTPRTSAKQLIQWAAEWVDRGGESLGKPTHFQVRDGKF